MTHISVLNQTCLDLMLETIDENESTYFADMTFGAGGHTFGLLQRGNSTHVVGIDVDPGALAVGEKNGEKWISSGRLALWNMNFEDFPKSYLDSGKPLLKGIILDLGISSTQVDDPERGLSFRHDGPLDMRLSQGHHGPSAAEVVESLSERELADIIFKYGEERLSRKIAKNIVLARKEKKIETTKDLESIVFHSYPAKARHGRIHPATRTFQALRIFVNRELEVLENVLPELFPLLAPGGRLLVISFHSLEDRIVKHTLRNLQKAEPDHWKILTKRPLIPSSDEVEANPRARSAKLRVLERLR